MAVDQELVDAAIGLARTRFPGQDWSGAAALRLDDGAIVTSTAPEFPNDAVRPLPGAALRLKEPARPNWARLASIN
jgi:hypothetical protein